MIRSNFITKPMTLKPALMNSHPKHQEYIDTLEKEREEYKNQALRAAAELQNVLRRTDKEKKEIQEYANRYLLEKMLPNTRTNSPMLLMLRKNRPIMKACSPVWK